VRSRLGEDCQEVTEESERGQEGRRDSTPLEVARDVEQRLAEPYTHARNKGRKRGGR
jgi:hypothetical protein